MPRPSSSSAPLARCSAPRLDPASTRRTFARLLARIDSRAMGAVVPRDSSIAVVGDGFGSLIVFATAMYLGFRPEDVSVFGPSDNPVGTYQQFAFNLGQTVLRSESESHFFPADWPTFAQLDAWSRRSIRPLLRTTERRYNPGVPEILTQAGVVARRLNWEGSRVPRRVGWLQREVEPTNHFVLYDEDANFIGRARHVMLAMGHGPLCSRRRWRRRVSSRSLRRGSSRHTPPSSMRAPDATSSSAPESPRSTSGRMPWMRGPR